MNLLHWILGMLALLATVIAPMRVLAAETMKRSKSLKFDGRSVEAGRPGRFDSFTHLSEESPSAKNKRLYSLPKDFHAKSAEQTQELGYRK